MQSRCRSEHMLFLFWGNCNYVNYVAWRDLYCRVPFWKDQEVAFLFLLWRSRSILLSLPNTMMIDYQIFRSTPTTMNSNGILLVSNYSWNRQIWLTCLLPVKLRYPLLSASPQKKLDILFYYYQTDSLLFSWNP